MSSVLDRAGENVAVASGAATLFASNLSRYVVLSYSTNEVVAENEGLWTVRDLHTGIFGAGDDVDTATDDFHLALREHLDVLERQPDLSEGLEAQLRYLRDRIQ